MKRNLYILLLLTALGMFFVTKDFALLLVFGTFFWFDWSRDRFHFKSTTSEQKFAAFSNRYGRWAAGISCALTIIFPALIYSLVDNGNLSALSDIHNFFLLYPPNENQKLCFEIVKNLDEEVPFFCEMIFLPWIYVAVFIYPLFCFAAYSKKIRILDKYSINTQLIVFIVAFASLNILIYSLYYIEFPEIYRVLAKVILSNIMFYISYSILIFCLYYVCFSTFVKLIDFYNEE